MALQDVTISLSPVKLLGEVLKEIPNANEWEPEALFAELEDSGTVTSALLQDKLQAALVVKFTDDVFLSAPVFENVCHAFNDVPLDASLVQEPSVPHMAYTTECIAGIRHGGERSMNSFDAELERYMAVTLYRDGWVLVPKQLEFVQDDLDALNHNSKLATGVRKRWQGLDLNSLDSLKLDEDDPIDVQVSKLAEVYFYIQSRKEG